MTAEGRTKTRRSFLCPAVVALFFLASSCCLGATLQTLDAKTYEGEIKLEKEGQIVVTAADAKTHRFDLSEVLHVTFGPDSPVAAIPAAARTENGQIPAPWHAFDVGHLAQKGYARFNGDVFSVKSAGGKIGEDRDAFCFVAQSLSGDGEIVARFMTVNDPHKVVQGLMIRSSADPGATFAGVFCVDGDMRFFTRTRQNGATDSGTVGAHRATLPFWARITRKGDELLASFSQDGKSWERVGRESISMRAETLAGIATCGKSNQLQGGHVTSVRLTASALAAAAPPPQPLKQGLTLRSGTFLAGAQIEKADDSSIRFGKADRHDNLPLTQVSRIVFRDLEPDALAAIPPKTTGLLLKEGDFVEGDFKGMRDGRILISSVLFGLARFEAARKAAALVLNDLDPAHAQMIVRTHDGSVYFADSVTPEKDKLIVDDPAAGKFAVNRWDVTEISLGGGRMQSLATMRPAKIDTPTPGKGFHVDSTGSELPPALPGVAVEHALALAPGATVTWNLVGAYRTFTFTPGVPRGASHTAKVRFTVVGDDKELYKSPPQTSLDAARLNSVNVKGVQALTLKVESPDKGASVAGLFANPALIK